MQESAEKEIHFLDYWRVIRSRKEIILAVTLLVVITACAYTFTRPKIYMASARIEVRQDTLDVPVFEREVVPGYNPFFMRTQYEIIKSRDILTQVIEKLNLSRVWGEAFGVEGNELTLQETLPILREAIRVAPSRDTSLIDIEVYDQDPQLAANIANAVAIAYRDRRLTEKEKAIRRAIQVLSNELRKQQEVVNRAEEELEQIRRELDISILGVGGDITADTVRLKRLVSDRIEAEVDMRVRGARLNQLLELGDDQLVHALHFVTRDPTLSTTKNALIDFEVNLRLALEQYGPEHPDVKRLQAGVDELRKRLQEALEGVKQGLIADYQVAKQRFEELDSVLEKVRRQDIESQGERMLPFKKATRNVDMQRQILNALQARVAQEGIEIEVPRTPVDIIETAITPRASAYVSPNYVMNLGISIFVGLALGVGIAYFIEYLDTSVKTVDDVEQTLGLPVIGIIPQKVRPLSEEGPESPHAESYRLLRTNMHFMNKGIAGGAFAVVSGGMGEGKSTTLFNVAYVCAQMGDRVLIVDSDLRRPVQHTFLAMSNKLGLTNLLMRETSLEESIRPTSVPNLHMLTSGKLPRTAVGLLDSQAMRDLVKNLKSRYDYIFFDSPPLMGVSDASILASEVDAVLLVVQYRKYPRTISTRARRIIENVGGRVIGVVLNNINIMRDDYYYYYQSQYTESAPEEKPKTKKGDGKGGRREAAVEQQEVF